MSEKKKTLQNELLQANLGMFKQESEAQNRLKHLESISKNLDKTAKKAEK